MPNARGLVSMSFPAKGKGSLDAAVRKLDKKARQDMKVLKKEIVAVTQELQGEIVVEVNSQTGLPKRGAKRRVKLFKGKKSRSAFAGLRLGERASIIHAGRLKGVRQRKGKVSSVPGVPLKGAAFLMKPTKWKGERRRIYQKVGKGTATSVNHPTGVVVIFEDVTKRKAQRLLRKAWRRARMKNPGLRVI